MRANPMSEIIRFIRSHGMKLSFEDWAKKPAKLKGVTEASVPPQTMTSASPFTINRDASPMECKPVVHAVETQ